MTGTQDRTGLNKEQSGFRMWKGPRDASSVLQIISERVLAVREEVCFIDWQNTLDRVNWTKLIHSIFQ